MEMNKKWLKALIIVFLVCEEKEFERLIIEEKYLVIKKKLRSMNITVC